MTDEDVIRRFDAIMGRGKIYWCLALVRRVLQARAHGVLIPLEAQAWETGRIGED
jgi:hypothetical protein